MYAQNAYIKQRQDNLLPTRSPSNSDNDQRQRLRREGPVAAEEGMFRSSVANSYSDFNAAMDDSYRNRSLMRNPFTDRHEYHPRQIDERVEFAKKRRRVRQLLLLASLAFVGLLVIDGMAQFHYLPEVSVETVYETAEHYERKLVQHRQQQQRENDSEGGLVRRLVGAFLGDEELTKQRPHIVIDDSSQSAILDTSNNSIQRQQPQRTLLHTLPLIPRHALQHRQRRELIASRKPIPRHLRENVEDEMYHAPHHQRRRVYYSMMTSDRTVVDERNRHLADDEGSIYETGALYQGYGTHYLDLWVGTPPQRQTVIVDTGSSITAL